MGIMEYTVMVLLFYTIHPSEIYGSKSRVHITAHVCFWRFYSAE